MNVKSILNEYWDIYKVQAMCMLQECLLLKLTYNHCRLRSEIWTQEPLLFKDLYFHCIQTVGCIRQLQTFFFNTFVIIERIKRRNHVQYSNSIFVMYILYFIINIWAKIISFAPLSMLPKFLIWTKISKWDIESQFKT